MVATMNSETGPLSESALMNAYQIGAELRSHVLRDHRYGHSLDTKRLQALIADLCGHDQELMPPLRHLVASGSFASAVGMNPPLAGELHLKMLSDELAQVFAPTLCTRIQPVLAGLTGVAATSPASFRSAIHEGAVSAPEFKPAATGLASPSARGSGNASLIAVLAFLSGVLMITLAAIGHWLWQRQSTMAPLGTGSRSAPSQEKQRISSEPVGSREMPAPPELPAVVPSQVPMMSGADQALNSINALYSALSAKDFETSNKFYGSGAADQFSPAFFDQFKRVTVQNLQVVSRTGSTLNLEGEVTFVWPDGSLQSETRSFSVDTGSEPAMITASEFGRVIRPRR